MGALTLPVFNSIKMKDFPLFSLRLFIRNKTLTNVWFLEFVFHSHEFHIGYSRKNSLPSTWYWLSWIYVCVWLCQRLTIMSLQLHVFIRQQCLEFRKKTFAAKLPAACFHSNCGPASNTFSLSLLIISADEKFPRISSCIVIITVCVCELSESVSAGHSQPHLPFVLLSGVSCPHKSKTI